jgi:hypothetical protein
MKRSRLFRVGMMAVMAILALGLVVPATAQFGLAPGAWRSVIEIQNLGDNPATIVVTFVDYDGAVAGAWSPSEPVPVGGGVGVYLPDLPDSQLAAGAYSLVLYSSEEIGVTVTNTDYDYYIADSYNSHEPATQVSAPLIYRDHNGWNSEVFVQNTGDTEDTAYIQFVPGTLGTAHFTSVSVPPLATRSFDVTGYTTMGHFIGTAIVTSTSPLTVMVNNTRIGGTPSNVRVLTELRGVVDADAGNRLAMPALYKNFGAGRMWRSAISLQNPSDAADAEDVTIVLTGDPDSPGGASQVYTKTLGTIGPGQGAGFYLPGDQLDDFTYLPDNFVGSAVVQSTGAALVGAVMNTAYDACTAGYCGVTTNFVAAPSGTSQLSAPALYNRFGPYWWDSTLAFQNVSATDSCTCTITFRADPASPSGPFTGTKSGVSLLPGQGFGFYLPAGLLDAAGSVPTNFKGSATVECTGDGAIAGTVVHTSYGRGVASTYNAISY